MLHKGYQVLDQKKLQDEVLRVTHMYTSKELTLDNVSYIFGYTSLHKAQQSVAVMLGSLKLTEKKRAEVALRLANIAKKTDSAQPQSGMLVRTTPHTKLSSSAVGLTLKMAARNIESLTEVAEYLASPASSEAERALLHSLAGDDAVLKLIAHLRPLCSETVFRLHTQQNRGKK